MSSENTKKQYAISTTKAPIPLARYSQAVVVNNTVYIQGTLGIDPQTGKLAGETIEQQTEQALNNLKAILEAAGSKMCNVVKTTVFLSSLENYRKFNEIYALYFPEDPPPARTTVEAKLPLNALIEIEAIAII